MSSINNSITDIFIEDLYKMSKEGFPESVKNQAKKCLVDYLGVSMAGSVMLKSKVNIILEYLESENKGVSIIGLNRKANIQTTVLINGLLSHVADFDDGARFGMMHPGAPILSTLIPLAELKKLNGQDLLRGIIIGYEAAIRIARTIQPSHKGLGFHATGTCGTIGAAMGAAAMMDFNIVQYKNTLAAALTGASGILKMIDDSSELKPYNVGQAAVSGLQAVLMSLAGFRAPDDALFGDRGFIKVMANNFDVEKLKREEQNAFCIEQIYMKPYAACRHSHSAIEAALKIKKEYGIKPEEIEKINVYTYHWAVEGHEHTHIKGAGSAKMSTPFSIAVALFKNKAGIQEFLPDMITDKNILELAKKINVVSNEELTKLVPEKRTAIVEIKLREQDKTITKRINYSKGEPENPLSFEDIKEKFTSLLSFAGKSKFISESIIICVLGIEENLNELYKHLE